MAVVLTAQYSMAESSCIFCSPAAAWGACLAMSVCGIGSKSDFRLVGCSGDIGGDAENLQLDHGVPERLDQQDIGGLRLRLQQLVAVQAVEQVSAADPSAAEQKALGRTPHPPSLQW